MKINKIKLDDLTRCYCTSSMMIDDELTVFFASEDPMSCCYAYSKDNFSKKETVWNDRGGCMSIISIPNKKNEFLAINEFYLKQSPSLSKLVWGKKTKDGWIIKDIISLPYLHRFDIYEVNGVNYLICATIAESKENKDDWTHDGKIYGCVLNDNLEDGIKLEIIGEGYNKNHGYFKSTYENRTCGLFASVQGVIRVCPPIDLNGKWTIDKIMDKSISEIAVIDIDNDGIDEIMTIEPFHGNIIKIYKLINNEYVEVYKYANEIDFAHALNASKIAGINTFVAGVRRKDAELFTVQYIDGKFVEHIIEKGVGPANISIVNLADKDLILSANHTKNEAAIYTVEED